MKKLKLECRCGAKFTAPASLAGQVAECKRCGFEFTVPGRAETSMTEEIRAPTNTAGQLMADADVADWASRHGLTRPSESDLQDELPRSPRSETACTSCGQPLAEDGVLCLHCGYHSQLDRQLRTANSEGDTAAKRTALLVVIPTSLVAVTGGYLLQRSLNGPTFLAFYFGSFALLGLMTGLARRFWVDSDLFNYAALITLFSLGVTRIGISIRAGHYHLSFLLLGMVAAASVFLWARTETNNEKCQAFAAPSGGLALTSFFVLLLACLLMLGSVFFLEPVSSVLAQFGYIVPFLAGLGSLGWLFHQPGSGNGGGWWGTGCSSCGSSCGGGGCGGGCGGCGD